MGAAKPQRIVNDGGFSSSAQTLGLLQLSGCREGLLALVHPQRPIHSHVDEIVESQQHCIGKDTRIITLSAVKISRELTSCSAHAPTLCQHQNCHLHGPLVALIVPFSHAVGELFSHVKHISPACQ